MLNKKRVLFIFIILMLVLSACNLPSGNGDTGGGGTGGGDTGSGQIDDLALTVTAQYILLNQVTSTPEFTATPQFTTTPENTATPSVPQVTVSVNTNCRTGPGLVYLLLGGLNIGQVAEVVGKSTSTGYWIIKLPGTSTICWLFPQHATVTGNTANLPEYPVPPTPTPTLPDAPKKFKVEDKNCVIDGITLKYKVTLKLTWEDVATNETGYRIYENGVQIIALAADSTSYTYNTTIPIVPPPGSPAVFTYTIEAYNSAGNSNQKDATIQCQ
jgi:hypothetical protein